ncbi:MAG: GNAT family protein [Deinococcus sp.]|uniref:GNAT family N-acetyltransferase n=1 Tax=Deinococcus sp. TaxID=47478 RepID=UPI0026DB021B|nr:GNAT family protein [Deinococcus sp.]MDO4246639.1 GNAT family protein [Deinococcus sp.]
MIPSIVKRATLATLPDAFVLHPDPAEVQARLERFLQRVADGKASPDQFVILRSERGVEGVATLAPQSFIPLLIQTRSDTASSARQQFFAALLELAPERTLLLDSGHTPPDAAPALAAGWTLDDEQVVYETDLSARRWTLAPNALEGGAELLERPDIRALAAELGQADLELGESWRLVALLDETGNPTALGAVGPSGRPDWASIDLIGVREAKRSQGSGTRLHAHLLARAAQEFGWHVGRTEAENHAMRRVFERNGSREKARQLYFRPALP